MLNLKILENYWLRKYRNIPTLTVSQSTKDDLSKLNFSNKGREPIPEIRVTSSILFFKTGILTK